MILFRRKTPSVAVAKNEQGHIKIVTVETCAMARTLAIERALPVSGLIDVRVNEGELYLRRRNGA